MSYLDNAATSYPKPESVYKRIDHILRSIGGNPGRSGHSMALDAGRVIFEARESAARLFNVKDASRIAFTKNATEAINVAFKGILKPGDHVVTTSIEHNAVMRPLQRLERDWGVKLTRVKADKEGWIRPGDIEKAITNNTKLVSVVHASNVFGAILPVREIGNICRKKGIIFMIDGAQTAGAMQIDIEALNIDIFAATGHKSLFGPQGTGFLYVREGIEPLPLVDGGTAEDYDMLEVPDRLESGTMNTPGIGGLGAGIEFLLKEGMEKIRRHEEGLIRQILDGLKGMKGISIIGPADEKKRTCLVSFNIYGKNPSEIGDRLDNEFDIMVRCGLHCAPCAHKAADTYPNGTVRVSPGYFNTPNDIYEFLKAIRKIV